MDNKSPSLPLSCYVSQKLTEYLAYLKDYPVDNLYAMVLAEVEVPLLKEVMKHVHNNQTNAVKILGISRGTLRKKLKQYNLG